LLGMATTWVLREVATSPPLVTMMVLIWVE